MGLRQALIFVAFLATACLAELWKDNAVPINLVVEDSAEIAQVNLRRENRTDVQAGKKTMINFAKSEISDLDNSGKTQDVFEEDQSALALEKEKADYDDEEIESQGLEDDNDIEDLSGGETPQSNEEVLSFDNDNEGESETYDDYDPDEDSAADAEGYDNDSDANFTEADDEQVGLPHHHHLKYQITDNIPYPTNLRPEQYQH